MMTAARILAYGKNLKLLETRRLVLMQGGFEVTTVQTLSEFGSVEDAANIACFVLCHTLSVPEQQAALRCIRSRVARSMTVVMNAMNPEFALMQDEVFISPYEGPEALIAAVRSLVEANAVAASVLAGGQGVQVSL
jgi:hypothetical protein